VRTAAGMVRWLRQRQRAARRGPFASELATALRSRPCVPSVPTGTPIPACSSASWPFRRCPLFLSSFRPSERSERAEESLGRKRQSHHSRLYGRDRAGSPSRGPELRPLRRDGHEASPSSLPRSGSARERSRPIPLGSAGRVAALCALTGAGCFRSPAGWRRFGSSVRAAPQGDSAPVPPWPAELAGVTAFGLHPRGTRHLTLGGPRAKLPALGPCEVPLGIALASCRSVTIPAAGPGSWLRCQMPMVAAAMGRSWPGGLEAKGAAGWCSIVTLRGAAGARLRHCTEKLGCVGGCCEVPWERALRALPGKGARSRCWPSDEAPHQRPGGASWQRTLPSRRSRPAQRWYAITSPPRENAVTSDVPCHP